MNNRISAILTYKWLMSYCLQHISSKPGPSKSCLEFRVCDAVLKHQRSKWTQGNSIFFLWTAFFFSISLVHKLAYSCVCKFKEWLNLLSLQSIFEHYAPNNSTSSLLHTTVFPKTGRRRVLALRASVAPRKELVCSFSKRDHSSK